MRFAIAICFTLGFAMVAPSPADAEEPTMPFEMSKQALDVGIVVSDLEQAKKFYGGALGLRSLGGLNVELPGGGDMARFQAGASTVKLRIYPTAPPKVESGVMAVNGMRLLTLFIKDPEALAKQFTDNGFTAPRFGAEQPAGYRLAFVRDPDGNQIELVHYPNPPAANTYDRMQIGLTVSDSEKMREFYGKTLGLKEREPIKMNDGTMEYMFDAGASTVKFWSPSGERKTRSGPIGDAQGIRYFTFSVRNVDAVHEALKARGVVIARAPMDLGTIARILLVQDPDGNIIEFAGPRPRQ